MGDWNRPRHLVLAVSSKIKVMCHSCIFIVFLIQCIYIYIYIYIYILSHLQHNIIECMRGVYVLAKHSSLRCGQTILDHAQPPCPAHDQNLPGSPPSYFLFGKGSGRAGLEASDQSLLTVFLITFIFTVRAASGVLCAEEHGALRIQLLISPKFI